MSAFENGGTESVREVLAKYGKPDSALYEDDFNKGYCAGVRAMARQVEEAMESKP